MKYRFPNNEGKPIPVYVTSFGMLCCTGCKRLLWDSRKDGVFPDVCPLCKGTLDYSILDVLRSHPIVWEGGDCTE